MLPRAQETQSQRLLALLRRNADTEFGRRHGFASLRDARAYARRVPVRSYEDLRPDLERMARGERAVLAVDAPIAVQRTGGSSGGAKRIPYTEPLLAAFRRALLAWLDDVAQAYPQITRGQAYWSISPVGQPNGLESDAAYFGADLAPLLMETLAVDPKIAALPLEQWRETTRARLAECHDLALISIWSPTFLSGLVDSAAAFPRLKLISCWDQGSSRPHAEMLRARFPGVRVQGKGLLATEGIVTLPLEGLGMPVLAVDSGFFEFRDAAGRCLLAGELAVGSEYDVIMTTEAGLYRYAIGDRVKVHGYSGEAPLLEFIGRGAQVSDLCGEKLSEDFVLGALKPLALGFAMLHPDPRGERYVLVVEAEEVGAQDVARLAARADSALCRNPQYAYARRLGQLQPLSVARRGDALGAWLRACLARGQRLGDIKPPALCTLARWDA